MGEHSEITAKRLKINRKSQDELGLQSHQNYIAAREKTVF